MCNFKKIDLLTGLMVLVLPVITYGIHAQPLLIDVTQSPVTSTIGQPVAYTMTVTADNPDFSLNSTIKIKDEELYDTDIFTFVSVPQEATTGCIKNTQEFQCTSTITAGSLPSDSYSIQYVFEWIPTRPGTHKHVFEFTENNLQGAPLQRMTHESYVQGAVNVGKVEFTQPNYDVREGEKVVVVVKLTGDNDGIIRPSIVIGKPGDTASSLDYIPPESLHFIHYIGDDASDLTQRGISFNIPHDLLNEGEETLTLRLVTDNIEALGEQSEATVTISDSVETGRISFLSTVSESMEGGDAIVILERLGGAYGEVIVSLTAGAAGDSANQDDIAFSQTDLVWQHGDQAAKTLSIPVINDALMEPEEQLTLKLSSDDPAFVNPARSEAQLIIEPSFGNASYQFTGLSQIPDSNTLLTSGGIVSVTFSVTSSQTGGDFDFRVLDNGSNNVTADFIYDSSTNGTSCLNQADYISCTFPSNGAQTSYTHTWIVPVGQHNLSISNVDSNESISTSVVAGQPGTITFKQGLATVHEGNDVVVYVERVGGSAGPIEAFLTMGNPTTDSAGTDDFPTVGQVSRLYFNDGQAGQKSISIRIFNDGIKEGTETLTLSLTGTNPLVLGTYPNKILSILDSSTLIHSGLSFDVDADGILDANTDAQIIIRYLFGFRGNTLIEGKIGQNALRSTSAEIETYLNDYIDLFDIDGNGSQGALTDGILIARYLDGFRGDELINGVVDPGGTRTDAASIETYLSQYAITATGQVNATPSKITVVSGDRQTGMINTVLSPLVVLATDSDDNPLTDTSIYWSAEPANSVNFSNTSNSVTSSDGTSSNTITLLTDETIVITAIAEGISSVSFTINPSKINQEGLTTDEQSIAIALDTGCDALRERSDLTAAQLDLLSSCDQLSIDPEISQALLQLIPDELRSQMTAAITAANLQVRNVNTRLTSLRGGARGVDISGINLSIDGQTIPGSVLNMALNKSATSRGTDIGIQRWGAFINGNVSFGKKGRTSISDGFEFDARGITAGIDYRESWDKVFGLAIGYDTNETTYAGDNAGMDMDSLHLSLYGSWYKQSNLYIDGLIKLGWNDYDTRRDVTLSGNDQQILSGSTASIENSVSIGAGYDKNIKALTIGGYGRFDYTYVTIEGYNETASNLSAPGIGSVLHIDNQKLDSITATVGSELSYSINTKKGIYVPHLRLEWDHLIRDNRSAIEAQFIHDPTSTSFSVASEENPDTDYFNLGTGISVITPHGKSGFFYIEKRFDQDNAEQTWIKGGIRIEF